MRGERGITVDHTTLYRWVQKYAPEIEKRLRWHRRGYELNGSWRVDETYVKVKGEWKYLYRAVSAEGDTIDFYLSHTRSIWYPDEGVMGEVRLINRQFGIYGA
jgi:transposase-like protein